MAGENREVYLYVISVGILSAAMGVVLAFTWDSIYRQVTELEALVIAEIPVITSGGIQIAAMFGLGLYVAWGTLFTLDWRKRYQGALILGMALIILFVLGLFGQFLPQMVEHPGQNTIAFITGISLGVITEIHFPKRGTGDLFQIEFSESSLRPLRIMSDGKEAEFPIAAYGLYGLIIAVVVGANMALWTTEVTSFLVFVTGVVSLAFAGTLYGLVKSDLTRSDLDIGIIGPQGSGKTLFFYGIDQTVRYEDENAYEHMGTNTEWFHKLDEMETSDEPWLSDSTKKYSTYAFAFRYGKLNRRIKMVLHDFPGEQLNLVTSAVKHRTSDGKSSQDAVMRTDGGAPRRTDGTSEEEDDEEDLSLDEDTSQAKTEVDNDTEPPQQTPRLSDNLEQPVGENPNWGEEEKESEEPDEGLIPTAEADTQEDGDQEETKDLDAEVSKVNSPGDLANELTDCDILLVLIDTRKVIESGIHIDPDNYPGKIGEYDDNKLDPEITTLDEICTRTSPEKVVAIASKADLLIDKYKEEYPNANKPHTAAGDFEEFTEFVDQFYDRLNTYNEFKATHDINTIRPIYFQTKIEEGKPEPVKETGKLQPEGYEQILNQIVKQA